MPLDTLGMYIYFLLLAVLYGSPLILLLLVFRYRQGKLFNGIITVLIAVPLVALALMMGFRLDLWRVGFEHDRQEAQLNETFDRTAALSKYSGYFESSFIRSDYEYSRYQFEFGEGRLELVLPPANVTSVADLKFVSTPVDELAETAQLWLLGTATQYEPVGTDRHAYFKERLGVPAPEDNVIFMRLYPGSNSSVKYWAVDESGVGRWRYQMLIVDWGSLPE